MSNFKTIIYYICFILFTIVYFPIFSIIYLLTLPFDKERSILHHASRFWSRGIYRMGIGWHTKVSGLEKIDRKKPYVVLVNHQAFLDIPLMYVLPMNFKWVSKKEVYKIPVFGQVLFMHGDIAIDRKSGDGFKKMLRESMPHLKHGTSIIIFPEGTRSHDGQIHRFREGAFALAKHAGVDILPVVAEGTGKATNGWRINSPHTFTVRVLDPITAEEIAGKDLKTITADINALMSTAHREIAPEAYMQNKN